MHHSSVNISNINNISCSFHGDHFIHSLNYMLNFLFYHQIIDTPQKSGSGKNKTGSQSGTMRVNLPSTRTLSSNSRSAPAKASPAPGMLFKTRIPLLIRLTEMFTFFGFLLSLLLGSKAPSAGEVSIYVDLTYIPSGASSATVTEDFFRCIRSSCYIISGNSLEREKLMRQTLDALLEGKASWPEIMQVKKKNEILT